MWNKMGAPALWHVKVVSLHVTIQKEGEAGRARRENS